MKDILAQMLFDKRIEDSLSKAALFHNLRGQFEQGGKYLAHLAEIKELKIKYEKRTNTTNHIDNN